MSYRILRAFVHEGRYVTPENVDTLPEAELQDRVERGYLENLEAPQGQEAAAQRVELAGVDFASDTAAEEAARAGLTARHFQDQTGSGKDGAFTAADVRQITSAKE